MSLTTRRGFGFDIMVFLLYYLRSTLLMTSTFLFTASGQPWTEHDIIRISLKIEGSIRNDGNKLILPGTFTEAKIRQLIPGLPKFDLSLFTLSL